VQKYNCENNKTVKLFSNVSAKKCGSGIIIIIITWFI